MRRNVMFERGRGFRVEDDELRSLHLGPDRGAAIGEYASGEPGEYSDSYYGPADSFARRSDPSMGYTRDHYEGRRDQSVSAGAPRGARFRADSSYFGSGELREGGRSWADLGVHSVDAAHTGLTEPSHRGRGPKGYQRSDERLREQICEVMTDDPWLDASDVEVGVKDGEITLTGEVESRTAKWRAEDLVESCTGGALVHNQLRVRRR